jgi:glutathione S-transferase
MTIQKTESSWEQLLEVARNNTSARRVHRPGQSPSSAPIASSLHFLKPYCYLVE